MRLVVLVPLLVPLFLALAPGAAAACTPGQINYVVDSEYSFTCTEGFWRGALAVDFSQEESAIDVCLGDSCWEGCGNVLFYGTGDGTVKMDLLNMFTGPELRICTATVGRIYLY